MAGAILGAVALLGVGVWAVRDQWGGPTSTAGGRAPAAGTTDGATFVGRQVCAECHPRQEERWRGSHHDLTMQLADEKSVLGDFNGATFTHRGIHIQVLQA